MNDLVSIIMLSRRRARLVEESVKSVIVQTYQNWELLFVDDNSKDGTVSLLMDLMDEGGRKQEKWAVERRIHISQTVTERGKSVNRFSSMKEARGRWIAFLDAGDVWAPDKLEKQVGFMAENGYAFSYTQYGLMNRRSEDMGVLISGKAQVDHEEMLRCCWPAYLTVMYDAEKVGLVRAKATKLNNDYALWLNISVRHDCHLLPENLATMRTPYGRFSRYIRTDRFKWRYEVYRKEEDLGPVTSFLYTVRNGWYGIVKWWKYVKKA